MPKDEIELPRNGEVKGCDCPERLNDAVNYGIHICKDGERIAPENFYAEPPKDEREGLAKRCDELAIEQTKFAVSDGMRQEAAMEYASLAADLFACAAALRAHQERKEGE